MKGTAALTTVIEIRDKEGNKIGEKEVATYQGLLARAHEEGLRFIRTSVLQYPSSANGQVAIVRAIVRTRKGTYAGIGDATPRNVTAKVAPHFVRMAETRAKARALRDAVNIGTVSLEELGDLAEASLDDSPPARLIVTTGGRAPARSGPAPQTAESAATKGPEFRPMSGGQYDLLLRLATERGVPAGEIDSWMRFRLKVYDLADISLDAASQLIDDLKAGGHPLEGVAAA